MTRASTEKTKTQPLSRWYRIGRFIVTNIIFAILPIGITFAFRYYSARPQPSRTYVSDIVFLGVVISATVLGDVIDEIWRGTRHGVLLAGATLLLLALIGSTIVYTSYRLTDVIGNPATQGDLATTVQDAAVFPAIGIGVVSCLLGLLFEILLIRSSP